MDALFQLFPEQASTIAPRVDALYFYLVAISVFFSALIFTLVIYFAVKYRRRSENEPPPPLIPDSLALEIIWIVIPLALALIAFFWGARVYYAMARPPDDALEVFVVGRQWMWKFQHPDGQREINELHVPRGRPVKLTLASEDVIHSFFVPAFRVKHDVIPGIYTTVWFEATKTGSFHLFCAEYCGTQHSGMIGRVVVLEPDQYEAWLGGLTAGPPATAALGKPADAATGSPAARGQQLFQSLGCEVCHQMERQGIGPVLTGLFGTKVRLQSGETVTADENYIRESILNPQAKITAGFQPLMPPFQGRINEDEMIQLIAYIKSLGGQKTN
ncbi:MAG TPA: cytochrome c oxidase subunit II [Candidatus Eisenbacteria bacterium]|nr:cytochrome c oxidase subunit II [Candidatus Eisenbacteria bacterium]